MFQKELQVLEKKNDETLTKGLIKTSSFPAAVSVLFVKTVGKLSFMRKL